jgi:hypothetical protein
MFFSYEKRKFLKTVWEDHKFLLDEWKEPMGKVEDVGDN